MPNVLNEYAGDGVTQTFNFSMVGGYLSRDFVTFSTRANDDLMGYVPYDPADITWIGDYTVRTAAPIPVGTTFSISRATPLAPLVDFTNTSRITEENLDKATWQSVHITAETYDTVSRIRVVAAASKQDAADASLNAQLAADNAINAAASAMAASQSAGVAVATANTAMSVATEAKELIDEAVSGAVVSFNGRAGVVVPATGDYSKEMVGLGAVDNTSDMNKPVSAAVSAALGGKVDKVAGKQLSTEDYTTAEKTKLSGIAAGATANATDADLRDRSTHSGTQGMETITGLSAALDARVVETAATGAALLPSGTTAQRPDPTLHPSDLLVRGNTDTGKPEWYNRTKSAWQPFGDASGELFNYAWHNGPRASIDVGRVPTDGQQLLLLTHPDVCQAIWDGKQHAVDESVWQADPTKRNCWSRGDGSSWVRVPDLNAAVAGTGKPFYLRGGDSSLGGTSAGDAIRNILGTIRPKVDWGGNTASAEYTGALYTFGDAFQNNMGSGAPGHTSYATGFDASRVVPTADENRVKTAYGVMTVRVFTEVSNVGALDAGQLATQLGVVDAKVQALDANTGFTIIYPAGGSEAAPATVAINSRYVMPNPFPGFQVVCVAELFIDGTWGDTGWAYSSGVGGGYGTKASQSSSDGIVVQTGASAVSAKGGNTGGIFPSHVTTPTQCRVKVWKLKGAI